MAFRLRMGMQRHWQRGFIGIALGLLLAPISPAGNYNRNGDFEGTGYMNPTVYNESIGEWQTLLSRNNYNPESFFWGGPGWTAIHSDYDGDGRADIVAYNRSTGEWRELLSGTGYNFNAPVHITFGGTGWVVVTGDYDGDEKADYGASWPDSGSWRMWRSSHGYQGHDDSAWNGSGFRPVQR